jgi:hypothetical protein
MKLIRSRLLSLSVLCFAASSACAQQAIPLANPEVRGTVRLWAPAAQRIELDGKSYRLAKDVQVLDRNTRLLEAQRVRPGLPVLLLMSGGEVVTHVVINPAVSSPFDKVGP